MPTIPMSQGPQQSLNNSPVASQYTDFNKQFLKPNIDTSALPGMFAKIHKQQVDAQVEADMTDLRREIIRRRFGDDGKGGWSQVLGGAAMQADKDGYGLVDREDMSIQQFVEDLCAKQSPAVQTQFRQKSRDLLVANYNSLMQHTSQQAYNYAISQTDYSTQQRQDSAAFLAEDPVALKESLVGIQEQQKLKKELMGWSDQELSQQTLIATSTAVTKALDTMLDKALQNPAYARQASSVITNFGIYMTPDALVKYGKAIRDANLVLNSAELAERVLIGSEDKPGVLAYGATVTGSATSASAFYHRHIIPTESADRHWEDVPRTNKDGTQALDEDNKPIVDKRVRIGRYADGSLPKDPMYYAYGKSQVTLAAAIDIAKTVPEWKNLSRKDLANRLRNDPNFNVAVGEQIWQKCLQDNGGDIGKAAAAYHAGQGNVDYAVALDKQKGGDGSAWFKYYGTDEFREGAKKLRHSHVAGKESRAYVEKAVKAWEKLNSGEVIDDNGKKVMPTSIKYFQRMKTWMTRREIEQAVLNDGSVLSIECRDNPETLEREVNKIWQRQERMKADYVQEQANLYNQALDVLIEGKGDMDTEQFIALSRNLNATQLFQLTTVAKKIQANDDSSDPAVLARYGSDDDALYALTEEGLKLLRQDLSVKDYIAIRNKWYVLHHQAEKAQDQKDQTNMLGQAGVVQPKFMAKPSETKSVLGTVIPEFKDLDHDVRLALISGVTRAIGEEQQKLGRVLTEDERLQFIKKRMAESYDTTTWTGSIKGKTLFELGLDDLPDHNVDDARQVLVDYTRAYIRANGKDREPTKAEIREALVSLMINKVPPQWEAGQAGAKWPEHYDRYIRGQAKRKLSNLEVFKAFILMRMRGQSVEKTETDNSIDVQQVTYVMDPNQGDVRQDEGF